MFIEVDKWKPIDDFDFDFKNKILNIDTRDYHAIFSDLPSGRKIGGNSIKFFEDYKDDRFLFTSNEIKERIYHLKNKTKQNRGGHDVLLDSRNDWLKYIRIIHTEKGYIVANDYKRVLNRMNFFNQIRNMHTNEKL